MKSLRSICIFCGASLGAQPVYHQTAEQLGRRIAERQMTLVYGGSKVGLMGAVADAALAAGGEVVGVIPRSLQEVRVGHPGLQRLEVVEDMHARKARMAELSDAFIALPGGIGTLEELFEIWTWAKMGYHYKPVGLLNAGSFYDALEQFLQQMVTERFLSPGHNEILQRSDDVDQLLDQLASWQPTVAPQWAERR